MKEILDSCSEERRGAAVVAGELEQTLENGERSWTGGESESNSVENERLEVESLNRFDKIDLYMMPSE